MGNRVVDKGDYLTMLFHPICYVGVSGNEKGHPVRDNQYVRRIGANSVYGAEIANRINAIQYSRTLDLDRTVSLFHILGLAGK